MKPEKRIYEEQDKIKNFIIKRLTEMFSEFAEVYLAGSVLENKFGTYKESWFDHGNYEHVGSDIDVIIVTDKIPKEWEYSGVEREIGKIYKGPKIQIKGNLHWVDIIVPTNSLDKKFLNNKEHPIKRII